MAQAKLSALAALAGVQKASNIAFFAEHLDEFSFIPGATEENIAHHLVDNVDEYSIPMDMEEFFDFAGFGAHIAEEHDGQFVDGGFVFL